MGVGRDMGGGGMREQGSWGVLIPQSRHAGYIHGPWFLTPSREDSRIYISPAFLCFVTQQASISLGALAQVQNHLVLPIHLRFPLLSGAPSLSLPQLQS